MSRLTKKKIEDLRKQFPDGCRVRCIKFQPERFEANVPNGELGTVQQVYDNGLINVYWDRSGTTAVVPGVDEIEKVNMVRVIRKDPGEAPYIDTIEDDIYNLQSIVGGYVEHVNIGYYPTFGTISTLAILCDEESSLHNAEPNCKIGGCMFCGPIIICGDDGGPELADVPEDAMELIFGKEKE